MGVWIRSARGSRLVPDHVEVVDMWNLPDGGDGGPLLPVDHLEEPSVGAAGNDEVLP